MGVGPQYDLGGTKVLPEKLLESCQTNQSFFLSKLRCPPKKRKKRSLLKFSRFFCTNCGDLQKNKNKKKRSSITLRWFFCPALGIFNRQTCPNDMKLPKILTQYCPKNMKSPEISKQNRPKNMKLPWTPYTNPGGRCPPTSYAYGHDNLSPYFLRVASTILAPALCHFIDNAFRLGIFPQSCKTAKVVPLFKSGNTQTFTNYRPISIDRHLVC